MNVNFAHVVEELGPDATFRVANEARPPADYLFETLLPEMPSPSYTVESGTMTVRATMAGLAGMDADYPPSGVIEMSDFLEKTAKIANRATMTEAALRQLQNLVMQAMVSGNTNPNFLVREALNFLDKVIVQGHLDSMEYLRGQALVEGQIDWTFGDQHIVISYGIPTANILTQRTSTSAWDGTASKFWDDIRLLQSALRYNVRAFIVHKDTLYAILNNDVNKAEILRQDGMAFTIRRLIGNNERPASDSRDTITLIAYDKEGELIDLSNPGKTTKVPFMPKKKILAVANNIQSGYRVGQGSTNDPVLDQALGYTHLAPTVEGGGRPGRWARLYTPEGRPMQLRGEGVSNSLPVVEVPEKLAIASSEIGGS